MLLLPTENEADYSPLPVLPNACATDGYCAIVIKAVHKIRNMEHPRSKIPEHPGTMNEIDSQNKINRKKVIRSKYEKIFLGQVRVGRGGVGSVGYSSN